LTSNDRIFVNVDLTLFFSSVAVNPQEAPARMKRIDRDPEKFEVIDLFEAIARKRDLKLTDSESQTAFLAQLFQSFGSSKSNPIIIHGRRIESMFEHVAASLGNCILIKREDAGEVCSTNAEVLPPDFRLVLDGGTEILVEVKNCHKADPNYRYRLKRPYLNALKSYARVFDRELLIAVFWSRWKKWALVRPEDFLRTDTGSSISFIEAIRVDRMAMLGDVMIATTPPLAFRVIADPTKPRLLDASGQVAFTIGSVELYCNGQRIEDKFEQQLAFYFMLNSDWVTDEPRAEVVNNELVYFEYVAKPQELAPDQGFQCLGFLSDMISRHYNELTASEGKVIRLSPATDPGTLGVLIPAGYKGKQLPLWRFTVSPK
jgi:hypothetical protein